MKRDAAGRRLSCCVLALLAAAALLSGGCGKKGALTLRAYEPPPAPSGFSAIHREGNIILSWDFPAGQEKMISGFVLKRTSPSEEEKQLSAAPEARSVSDPDISNGRTYLYEIRTVGTKGVFGTPQTISIQPVQPPEPPKSLTAGVRGDSVVLSWEGGGPEFNVYRRLGSDAYGLTPLNSAPLEAAGYSDRLDIRKTAHYAVRSLMGGGGRDEGALSAEVTVDPLALTPLPPSELRWQATSDRIILSWGEPAGSWITGYRVYRRMGGGGFSLVAETQVPSFVDKEPGAGPRDYRITALGPKKEGPPAELTGVRFLSE